MQPPDKTRPLSDADRKAFHQLYQTHYRRVYSICFRMTSNAQDAEDLTQEVFMHLFRVMGSFRGESAFTTWLHRLTVNHVGMHFRKRRRRQEFLTHDGRLPVQVVAGSHVPNRMRVVDRILLNEALAKLPPGYREVFELHDVQGFEHHEIAALKGRTAGTSKSQLHKARRKLRELIGQTTGEIRAVARQY